MATTALSVQELAVAGTEATYTAAPGTGSGNGFEITYDDDHRTFVHVKNGGGGTIVVTLPTPGTDDGLAISDRTVSITTGKEYFIPLRRNYKQSDDTVHVEFDVITSVTVAALKVTLA
jgi:hypothetical protein